ncbi:LRR receptor-like serine/threonine-protein kinase RPK2 [Linum grandiflorum]
MAALLCFIFLAILTPSSSSDDSQSLLTFKKSISSDPSNLLSSWRSSSPSSYCSWFAVLCDSQSRRVISLNFTSSSSLVGTLPDSIGDLSALRVLVLSHHRFSGQIPASLSDLRSLEVLELQGNNFSGEIPTQISFLPSLRVLNLSSNSFSAQIPNGLIGGVRSLTAVDLSNNQLKGEIPVSRFANCSSLVHLKLSNNYLEKTIPSTIGRCKSLRTLLLDGNVLQGSIPPEIGQISELRILDVSTNSLTGSIPDELANCRSLAVLVLTNASNFVISSDIVDADSRLEFNAFERGIPHDVFTLPNLQILWAPRANLDGGLPSNWSSSCSLRVLQLGQNAFAGGVPQVLGAACTNLTVLDLSSNNFTGEVPAQLPVSCMVYFNVSQNHLSGVLPAFPKSSSKCDASMISYGSNLAMEDVRFAYSNIPDWRSQMNALQNDAEFMVIHDLSWNQLSGVLPAFSISDGFLADNKKTGYRLLLNENMFSGSFPGKLVPQCDDLVGLSVNLTANDLSFNIQDLQLLNCSKVKEFEAAHNRIDGSLTPTTIGNLVMLESFDLRGNSLTGSLPAEFGGMKLMKAMLLGSNNLTGDLPAQLGEMMTSLVILDLSHNFITGTIPESLADAKNIETMLLNNNRLSGRIPSSFSNLSSLKELDVSYNNLSGPIPLLHYRIDCSQFVGNAYLVTCAEPMASSPNSSIEESQATQRGKNKNNSRVFLIALITSVAVILAVSLVVVIWKLYRKRTFFSQQGSLRGKVVVTFADAPAELNYDNVLKSTGNFSVRYLIGTGGFGATYKAEIVPGYFVAVKRLSIGRIQGSKQFDAEIRTLGRIRHKNLVTLIGYYVGESEMLLIYNYLSGGNLETFIHDRSGKNGQWSVIYKIALDIAQSLTYLHYSCVPKILHRDIKPSNILLDDDLNAYLSDFGLARLLEVSQTHATTDVAGTFGYVAPEYATTCRVSDKSDVYSFGVVLLELMSGKKSLDPSFAEYGNGFNIVAWAKLLIKEGHSSELFSAELWETGPKENLQGMLKLASACTVESLTVRPSMKHVLEKLKQLKY